MEISSALKRTIICLIILVFIPFSANSQQKQPQTLPQPQRQEGLHIPYSWPDHLRERVEAFEKVYNGNLGIFIEDLNTKTKFAFNAGQRYYLASVVKIFVMVAIYKLLSENKLSLKDTVRITKSKYRDGAGYVNWMKPGQWISIKRLVKFMMEKSDNAATDILIDIAGLSSVDDIARRYGVFDLGELTTLLEVRKIVFRDLHPLAGNLTALDYMELWKIRKDYAKKLRLFSRLINKPSMTYTKNDLERGFQKYYDAGYNSASLIALSEILKKLAYGEIISQEMSDKMIEQLKQCKTGKNRIRKSLPEKWVFAHKTGTQHQRAADAGIAYGPGGQKILIIICTGDFGTYSTAESAMAKITKDFFELYKMEPKQDKVEDDFWLSPF